MADDKDLKSLEMRLTKLEDAIGRLVQSRKAADISAEEMKVYMKVRDSLDPDFCGPNDCMRLCIPFRCWPRCWPRLCIPQRCINECGGGWPGGGFGGGFSELGG
jgi:hypothetical protein